MHWILCHINLDWILFRLRIALWQFHNNNAKLLLVLILASEYISCWLYTICRVNVLLLNVIPWSSNSPFFSSFFSFFNMWWRCPGTLVLSSKLFSSNTRVTRSCFFYLAPRVMRGQADWQTKAQNTSWHFAAKCSTQSPDHLRAFLQVIQAYRHAHTPSY